MIDMKLKIENIFLLLYVSATFTKYAVTINNDLVTLIYSVTMDMLSGLIFYRLIKLLRKRD